VTAFCRDCLSDTSQAARRCPACGSPRLAHHAELDTLTIAHVDCDAFYASIEKRDDPALTDRLADAPRNPDIAPRHFLNEALSPLQAMLKTRDARGRYSRESLAWQLAEGHFLHFGLCRSSSNAPLGWVLSASTRVRMEQQLNAEGCGANFDNKASLETIGSHFGTPKP